MNPSFNCLMNIVATENKMKNCWKPISTIARYSPPNAYSSIFFFNQINDRLPWHNDKTRHQIKIYPSVERLKLRMKAPHVTLNKNLNHPNRNDKATMWSLSVQGRVKLGKRKMESLLAGYF